MSKLLQRLIDSPSSAFVAIDFETADDQQDSACAVALVRVENLRIVERKAALIRPPRRQFVFSYLHGISWADVATAPTFAEIWPSLVTVLDGADFLAAHNARFDEGVLAACCAMAGLRTPPLPFACTVQLARKYWCLPNHKLPSVCSYLRIPLQHHDAASDAEACARIVLAAAEAHRAAKPVASSVR